MQFLDDLNDSVQGVKLSGGDGESEVSERTDPSFLVLMTLWTLIAITFSERD